MPLQLYDTQRGIFIKIGVSSMACQKELFHPSAWSIAGILLTFGQNTVTGELKSMKR